MYVVCERLTADPVNPGTIISACGDCGGRVVLADRLLSAGVAFEPVCEECMEFRQQPASGDVLPSLARAQRVSQQTQVQVRLSSELRRQMNDLAARHRVSQNTLWIAAALQVCGQKPQVSETRG